MSERSGVLDTRGTGTKQTQRSGRVRPPRCVLACCCYSIKDDLQARLVVYRVPAGAEFCGLDRREAKMGKKDKKQEGKDVLVPEKTELLSPFDEMERWFGDFFNRPMFSPMWMPHFRLPGMQQLTPSIDVFEEADVVVIKAELPGIEKEDVEIDLSGDLLTISGEKKVQEKVEKKDYHRVERSYGSFTRSLRLPAEVLPEQAKALFKDGVLEIRIPKSEAARKKKRKIEIA